MPGYACPNDGAPMEPEDSRARRRRTIVHTCPECGWSERR